MTTQNMEMVEAWADFVRQNPDKWREIHTQFINAHIEMMNQGLNALLASPGGKERLIEMRGIKNKKLIEQL